MRVLLIIFMLCLWTAGCAHQRVGLSTNEPDIFWPKPPEIRKIQFIKAISGPKDMNIIPGFLTKVYHYIGGISEASIVSPYGITADRSGRVYVVDTFLHRVHVFDAGEEKYWAFPGDKTTLVSPVAVAVDDNRGLIFITDSKLGTVKVFKDRGRRLSNEFGQDLFDRPTGIAVNPETSELLVVDTLKSLVYRFDLSSLTLKGHFGGNGKDDGQFHYPTHISVSPAGDILVSDSLNFRVQVFSSDGCFLRKIGAMGREPGTFSRPKGVAADSNGNIYVVDALFDNVQIFDAEGRLLLAFGEHGDTAGAFWLPTGIYIDPHDAIYVSDSSNHRLQVFKYLKENNSK